MASMSQGAEQMELRFGWLALAAGYLTAAQLMEALAIQEGEDSACPLHRLLGRICLDQGYLSEDQVEAILRHQERIGFREGTETTYA